MVLTGPPPPRGGGEEFEIQKEPALDNVPIGEGDEKMGVVLPKIYLMGIVFSYVSIYYMLYWTQHDVSKMMFAIFVET